MHGTCETAELPILKHKTLVKNEVSYWWSSMDSCSTNSSPCKGKAQARKEKTKIVKATLNPLYITCT